MVENQDSQQLKTNKNLFVKSVLVIALIAVVCEGLLLFSVMSQMNKLEKSNLLMSIKVDELNQQVNKIDEDTKEIRFDHFVKKLSEVVDFSIPNVQEIGGGFFLVRAEQEVHLTGIKFKGRIINAQSVTHSNISFNITVSEKTKEFTINQISAGNSTSFSVYIPDLQASDAQYGKIQYTSSTVEYYTR
jgi:hypothetical protein